jgi:hypothetical protein
MDDTHMDVWRAEDTTPSAWETWAGKVETLLGHDLDGSLKEDGYSLDTAYDMWREGLTPLQAWAMITRTIAQL